MKRIIPQLYINNCKEAMDYYQKILGGEIKNIQTADEASLSNHLIQKILHGELSISENCSIYFAEALSENINATKSSMSLEYNSKEELTKVYEAFKPESTITYELQKTAWGSYYSILIDRYGNEWILNHDEH